MTQPEEHLVILGEILRSSRAVGLTIQLPVAIGCDRSVFGVGHRNMNKPIFSINFLTTPKALGTSITVAP